MKARTKVHYHYHCENIDVLLFWEFDIGTSRKSSTPNCKLKVCNHPIHVPMVLNGVASYLPTPLIHLTPCLHVSRMTRAARTIWKRIPIQRKALHTQTEPAPVPR